MALLVFFVYCYLWNSNASPNSVIHDPYLCYPGNHMMSNITANFTNITHNATANIHEYNPYNLPVKAVWCYDVDISPKLNTQTRIIVPIQHTQSNDNSNWNIFSVYFSVNNNNCFAPRISFEYEIVNNDTYYLLNDTELLILDDNGNDNICGDQGTINCGEIEKCVNDVNLNMPTAMIPMDSTYKISIYQYQSNNDMQCNSYFIVNTIITLICDIPDTNCETAQKIKHINWHSLQNAVDNSNEIPSSLFTMSLNPNKLELTFDINLEYIGLSSDGNYDKNYNLGTTYVVGFNSFGTTGNKINEPGNCENRILASFQSGNFNQWWKYSEYPYLWNQLGNNTYLSYPPPSNHWILSIGDDTCTSINYLGVFSWNDLTQCKDYNGNDLINVVDNDISITLSGTLYANLVSPYSMNAVDTGIYRSFPLIQQDFEISILKQINVLSSTGVELFITSIIGIYEDESDGSFELSILTQSADYIKLINPTVVATPFGIATGVSITSTSTTCLSASTYTCGQIFTLSISSDEINCPPADMSGVYDIAFDVECRFNEDVCNTFINDNPSGTSVALSVESNFIDTYCEPEMYSVIFEGDMKFYDDAEFVIDHSISGDNYVIGQDTIYVEIVVDFPEDGSVNNYYNVFQVDVENVFVCTADDTVDMTQDLDQQNGNGGCLSSNIDADGAYDIIINGVEMNYDANIILTATESNVVRFSFKTFDIGRTKMY
eukprot:498826_1